MKKKLFTVLNLVFLLPNLLYSQVGPGLGNLTYTNAELYRSIWNYTEVNHYGSNIGVMQNGYLLTTFTPDSGKPPGGILVWDVSNPRKPVLVTRIYDSRTSTFREQHALPQHEDYVLFQEGFGFQIWDFSNPKVPVQSKRHIMSGYAHDDYGSTWQMFWQAPYIFIANGSKGFDVVDASNINNPVLVKHVNSPRQVGPIFAVGNLLYTSAHDFGKGFTIFDISNPKDPKLLNSFSNTENMYASMLNGNRMIISARGNSSNAIFGTYDVSDPLNIKKLTTLNIGNSGEQLYNSTQDQFIFQGCQNEVVKIDASNPTSQKIAGRGYLVTGNVDHGQVSPFGNLIFVGNDHGSGSGFLVHQISQDKKGPDVNMVVPKSNDINRALTSRIGVTLTDNILLETVNNTTFIVRPLGGTALKGKYSHQFSILNFSPDQPLLPNTTYEIVIPAGGIKDYAGNTVTKTFTSYFSTGATGSFPPSSISNPWVFEDDKKVTLNWNKSSNTTRYIIKRSTSPTGIFAQVGTTTTASYIDNNLTNETNYYYTVTPENSFGEGETSNVIKAKPAFYISSLIWSSATNAWGTVEKDQSNGEDVSDDGKIITLNGTEYSRGLGVHANSVITYNLNGKYSRFMSDIGVDDEVGTSGSVIFTVTLDGKQVYTSGLMNGSSANKNIDLNVSGGTQLVLTVSPDGDNGQDHASWGGARLVPIISNSPLVTITSPVNNSSYSNSQSITLTASASDSNGTITNVQFYDGTNLLNTDNTSPYSFVWTAPTVGIHTITAKATNSSGQSTISSPVIVNVTTARGPFNGLVHQIPGIIQFENYDIGGNGVSFNDESAGNTGGATFRSTEDVDIENCSDIGGGYNIGFATAGEWLEYSVNVANAGNYDIDIRVACNGTARTLSLSMDGINIASNIAVPNTGAWQTWQTVSTKNIPLTAGRKIMRLTIGSTDYVNLNYVEFKSLVTTLDDTKGEFFEVYPNPFDQDGFTLKTNSETFYRIYDLNSTEVENGKTDGSINLGKGLAKGLYILKINQNGKEYIKKITKN